jgi:polyisoprenoid-binding protein YceI
MNMSCRRTTSVSCLTVLTLLVIAGCQNPADDVAGAKVSPPKAETSTPAATSTSPKDSASREVPKDSVPLEISSQTSKIEFVGSKVTGSHNGGFKSFEGTWYLVPGKPEASKISAEIAMDSVWADNDKLTGHLKSHDFFDVAKFPKSTFESTEIKTGSSDAKAKDATHTVTGNLTLHGVTKSIQFPAKIAVTSDAASLDSEFFLNRKDFGVNYPGMANDLIRDEVVLKLAIRAPKKS